MTKSLPRVLPVSQDDKSCFIVCPYCRKIHVHGIGVGHRIAHCGDDVPSELRTLGYVIVDKLN